MLRPAFPHLMRSLHSPSLRPLHALLQDQLAVRSSFLFAFLDSSYSRPCQVEVEFDESLWDTDGCGDHRSNLCIGCIMAKEIKHALTMQLRLKHVPKVNLCKLERNSSPHVWLCKPPASYTTQLSCDNCSWKRFVIVGTIHSEP